MFYLLFSITHIRWKVEFVIFLNIALTVYYLICSLKMSCFEHQLGMVLIITLAQCNIFEHKCNILEHQLGMVLIITLT